MEKVTLTDFADEISSDLQMQLDCLQAESSRFLEFRGACENKVFKFDANELNLIKTELVWRGINVFSIGSPYRKIHTMDLFELHLQDFERAIPIAKPIGIRYIRSPTSSRKMKMRPST